MSLHNPDQYINRLKDKFPITYQELITCKAHPTHIAFDLINADVYTNKVPWTKCLDCGQPYVIGEGDSNATLCSEKCEEATRHYLGI